MDKNQRGSRDAYQNLPAGDYTLKHVYKTIQENDLNEQLFISYKSPWYKMWWAYLSYSLLVLLIAA